MTPTELLASLEGWYPCPAAPGAHARNLAKVEAAFDHRAKGDDMSDKTVFFAKPIPTDGDEDERCPARIVLGPMFLTVYIREDRVAAALAAERKRWELLRRALNAVAWPSQFGISTERATIDMFRHIAQDALAIGVPAAHERTAALPPEVERAHDRAERLAAQLPNGMEHCTILFKECEKGHGWLTATNWAQHGCPTCRAERLAEECGQWRIRHEAMTMSGVSEYPWEPLVAARAVVDAHRDLAPREGGGGTAPTLDDPIGGPRSEEETGPCKKETT
jgi:hypothetical protein